MGSRMGDWAGAGARAGTETKQRFRCQGQGQASGNSFAGFAGRMSPEPSARLATSYLFYQSRPSPDLRRCGVPCPCVPSRQPPTAIRFREWSPLAHRVLGAGVEPAHLAAPEPVSANQLGIVHPSGRFPDCGLLLDFFHPAGSGCCADADY
jgi:hypothetical protein